MTQLSPILLLVVLASIASGLASGAQVPAAQVFSVDTYGAKGDGQSDDGPAIRKAVADAVALGKPATVVLSASKSYYLAYDAETPFLKIDSAQDVVIDGQGATMLLQAPESAALISNSQRCAVKNLVIEYPKLPYTQGTVVAVDRAARSYDLRLDPSYDLPAASPAGKWWISVLGPTGHGLKPTIGDAIFLESCAPLEGAERTYRVTVKEPWASGNLGNLAPGDRSFLPTNDGVKGLKRGAVFAAALSADALFENLTIYSSPGMCFHLSRNTGRVTIRGCAIRVKPGTNRVMSSRSDGIHCDQNHVGPLIENCTFEGLMDDSINIHCMGWPVSDVSGDSQVSVHSQSVSFAVGDKVQAFDAESGAILGETTIAAISSAKGGQALTLASAIPGMKALADDGRPNTVFYNLNLAGNGFIIRHNTFLPQRRYACLIRAHDGVIEDNTIEGGAGMDLSNETGNFNEGPIPDDVIVRRNKFANSPGIKVETSCRKPSARAVRNILLEDNEFVNMVRWPIIIGNAENITLRNTTIRSTGQGSFPPISIRNSDTVTFDGSLAISDPSPTLPCLLQLAGVTDADVASIKLDWSKATVDVPGLTPGRYVSRK
ncbi:MAG: right-handed parallel beta-helix repeat-containing protein [Capsulimonadaceae bacterium]|nr:right-handed parallel beta-helix repeat-containing protein [Capsulimonadaceae bacterium]